MCFFRFFSRCAKGTFTSVDESVRERGGAFQDFSKEADKRSTFVVDNEHANDESDTLTR